MARARVGEIEIEYEVTGAGEPLVLIMGFAAQYVIWPEELVSRLVADGFQVIRFDHRDVGGSTKLDHLGVPNVRQLLARSMLGLPVESPYSLRDMAGDIVGLLDHLRIDAAHVMGVSMGGMIAQSMAIHFPNRVRTMTSVMSTPGGRRNIIGNPKALMALLQPPAKTREGHADRFVTLFRTVGSTGYPFDEVRVRELGGLCWDRGISPRGAARQFAAILADGKSRFAGLAGLRVPTLVIHGDADPLIPPRAGRATAALVPGARFLSIQGMGHDFPAQAMPLLAGAITSHVALSGYPVR